ncbi:MULTISPECIES: hypothetical protein [unclassified Legionella]|uniref:hypothetical protein n=1 Tax=unclassified Legionella TaxID=2622702 RepID=UPI001E303E8E|nr:hypothetical protein [Legionella sp. 31fI33]MCC5014145.1 hypothetical protein [Legionella sp. 31fI33]
MIIYNPLDGDALTSSIPSKPRHCFLMTRLGSPICKEIVEIGNIIIKLCKSQNYEVINASTEVTGRDFLLKIWKLIASCPIAIGICHEKIPAQTQENIYYEMGAAQALGKETIIIKSVKAKIPSDFVRTEYVEFNSSFQNKFTKYLQSLNGIAEHYETVSDQLERNPVLAIDYLKRAFLITGDERLRDKAQTLLDAPGLKDRAKNSVELIAATF